jgi:hypothetical protein
MNLGFSQDQHQPTMTAGMKAPNTLSPSDKIGVVYLGHPIVLAALD